MIKSKMENLECPGCGMKDRTQDTGDMPHAEGCPWELAVKCQEKYIMEQEEEFRGSATDPVVFADGHWREFKGPDNPMENPDGTAKLCMAVYTRPCKPSDYLGGSDAKMLHDAAELILAYRNTIAELQSKNMELEELIGPCLSTNKHPDEWKPRAATWHHERMNWMREVENLRAHIRGLESEAR